MLLFIRKNFLILLFSLVIYCAFFLVHTHTQQYQQILGATANLTLFEEPTSGYAPILSALDGAQKEIDIEVYLLSDKQIISALSQASKRGVVVNVLMEQHPFGAGNINEKSYTTLQKDGIHVMWTNPTFSLTHEKAILIDKKEVFILTQNLTAAAFNKNREYDILDTNLEDVDEIEKIFSADSQRQSFIPSDPHLVVSPNTARNGITSLIQDAKKELAVEMEVIDDRSIVELLLQKAKTIHIRLLVPSVSQVASNKSVLSELKAAGVEVKTISSPYMHAKMILEDNMQAYVGSVNLTTQSMDDNREVGIIISQSNSIQDLSSDFEEDWSLANPL